MSYKDPARAREYLRAWRDRNREHVRIDTVKRNLRNKRKKLAYIQEYKRNNPCLDCNNFFHPVSMDFDHVTGEKFMGIANMIRGLFSMNKIEEEIKKCELVCANCHRVRTHERKVKSDSSKSRTLPFQGGNAGAVPVSDTALSSIW